MANETRFADLLEQIPKGPFYDPQGNIIPFNNRLTTLRLETNFPNDVFRILVNDVQQGFVTTDVNGNAVFNVSLPNSDIELILERQFSTDKVRAILTARDYAVWLAAIAEQLEVIDASIDSTLASFYLEQVGPTDIDLAHGVLLQQPNESQAEIEAYRETLQLVRQSFRQFGGRLSGKFGVVAAVTQVNPLIFDRTKFGPRWILGFDQLPNGDFQDSTRIPTGALPTLNALGIFVTLKSIDDFVNSGLGTLSYNFNFKRFRWSPPALGFPVRLFNDTPPVTVDSEVVVSPGRNTANVSSLFFPLTVTAGEFDHLYIEIDNLGIVDVHLSLGGTLTIDDKVNGFIRATNPYNLKREVSVQPAGSLLDLIEVIRVSDGNPPGAGTLDVISAGLFITYAAIADVAGPPVAIIPNTVANLVSGNGIDNIDVLFSFITPLPLGTDTFTIIEKYISTAILLSGGDRLVIISPNTFLSNGNSEVTIHDGPANAGTFPISGSLRGHFDIPKIATTLNLDVTALDTSIDVPANEAERFSSSEGIVNTPFDVIIGYGIKSTVITAFTITPNINPNTAVVEITTGGIFESGDTHVILNITSSAIGTINNGAHKILFIDPLDNKKATISYNGLYTAQPSTVTGVSIINVDPRTAVGLGSLEFTFAGTTLEWAAPAEALGFPQAVGAGGYFRLPSVGFLPGAKFIDVLVDISALPGGDVVEAIGIGKFASHTSGGGDTAKIWASGEKVTIIDVTTGATDVWDLESLIVGNYDSGMTVYLANGRLPLVKDDDDDFGKITIDVDVSEEPAGNASDIITMLGSNLPTGWLDEGGALAFTIIPGDRLNRSILVPIDLDEAIIARDVLFTPEQCGLLFTFKVWITSAALDGVPVDLSLGFDFGSGFIDSPTFTISDPDETILQPRLIEFSQILPPDATQFRVRIKRLAATPEFILISRAVVVQGNLTALFLGHNTIPRSPDRASFGSLFYVWSPDILTAAETSSLGIDAPATGQIRNIHNAHEFIEAFNVTDVLSGSVTNVRGAMDASSFLASTLINMEVVERIPSRFSYIKPSKINAVIGEGLVVAGGPNTATLNIVSDENQSNAILFEDGIPVPNNEWVFNSSTEIEIITGFNPSAVYIIDYQALIQIETDFIDLDVPSNNGMDTWYADFVAWNRHLSDIITIRNNISVIFDSAFRAVLPRRSDQDKLQTVLTEDTGITRRTIPQAGFSYIDSLTIRINSGEFNSDAIYSLAYNQRITDPTRIVNIVSEIRSAASLFSLASASYVPFNINFGCVNNNLRFHQIRLTLSNVINLDDVRIHSAVVKGLNLMSTGSPPPGL